MKPKTKQRKEREIDKDTVVAYHDFIQGRIQGALNGVGIGPGNFLVKIAIGSFIFGFVCLLVGILVITLRHRHVYLVDWNAQFLGPFFVIMFLLCCGFATFLLEMAKRRTNIYRRDLRFRPIGDYGVAVVHTSKLTYDDQKRSELKSGTTPHNVRHPGRPGANEKGNRGDYSKSRGYDNRGYKNGDRPDGGRDYDKDKREKDREYRDMVHNYREGPPRRPEGERRPDDDRRRRPPPDDDRRRRPEDDRRRRPPDDDRRRRPPQEGDRERRPPDDREKGRRGGPQPPRIPGEAQGDRERRPQDDDRRRRPQEGDRERRPPDDREKGRRGAGPQAPRDPEEAQRREERRRQYEEEKRRRYEEDRKRSELRKQAEAEASGQPGEERGVDVDGSRTYQIQTTVKLSREMQGPDESDL